MPPRILITGSTGYIGGSVLAAITTAHPEYSITAILRKVSQRYIDAYPRVKTIIGDYDSAEVLAKAASESDVVIHAGDSDHKTAMESLLAGLGRRTTPCFLIHLSGTACISDVYSGKYGVLNPRVWSDVDDITVLAALPDDRIHRHVDKLCDNVPADIYGKGHGPGITQSFMVPLFYDAILRHGSAFYIARGENTRSLVHIEDVMSLYVRVVEEAVIAFETGIIREECWDANGFYFNSSSELVWKDAAVATGKIMASLGLVESAEAKQFTVEEVQNVLGGLTGRRSLYMFGSNSRSRADRGSKLFGWKPTGPPFMEILETDLLAHHTDKQRGAVGGASQKL
ncbi:nucleoside-diphosphate-sugar epimerase [Mycena maculata]|uniref:Nucleoside-diphosphate-sugar epimerase n=1 Tax=Mycena maculata TaxID=230809 RepID=A0AAD7NSM3_9AGAR|nr:nucleoside-diphosphate-sugar epimerase [Mycena maculata]